MKRRMMWVACVLVLAIPDLGFAIDRSSMPANPDVSGHGAVAPAKPDGRGTTIVQSRDATIYFDPLEFVPLLAPDYYFDDFAGFTFGDPIHAEPSWQFGPVNGYSYTASTPGGTGIFSIPGAVSTTSAFDPLLIVFDGLPVFAVGGDFFGTDYDGNPIAAVIRVTLADGTTVDLELPAVFVGFTSAEPIVQLTITTENTGTGVWVAYDNFYVGTSGPVAHEASSWSSVKALFR